MRFKVFLCVRAYKCTYVRREMNKLALYTNGNYMPWNVPDIFKVAVVSSIQAFAVPPEIVPVPESHRNVFTLAHKRSWRSITFGRSFSCQGTREKISLKGVTFKTPIFVRFFKTFFKKLKFCIVAQKHTLLIGRHLASLKKRLFLQLFYFRLNCTTKKPSHRQHK